MVTLVTAEQVAAAWNWIQNRLSRRPDVLYQNRFFYDRKLWPDVPLDKVPPDCAVCVSHLYLVSQLGDEGAIMEMVNGAEAQAVIYRPANLDRDVHAVVTNTDRFRDALSEHLAFWTRVASAAHLRDGNKFVQPLPNYQPEDKGPDGLFVHHRDDEPRVEYQSVKNSIRSPRGLIATASFRRTGLVDHRRPDYRPKQLEEFYLAEKEDWGFGRLDRLLSQAINMLQLPVDQQARFALLAECDYNAVVVADDKYAKESLFDGYRHVTTDPSRHVATYIGSKNWCKFAELVRNSVVEILETVGLV